MQAHKLTLQIAMEWDAPAAPVFGNAGRNVERRANFAMCGQDHRPVEARDFASP
jgi:hypothetical protein